MSAARTRRLFNKMNRTALVKKALKRTTHSDSRLAIQTGPHIQKSSTQKALLSAGLIVTGYSLYTVYQDKKFIREHFEPETFAEKTKLEKQDRTIYLKKSFFNSTDTISASKLAELTSLTQKELNELHNYVEKYQSPEEFKKLISKILNKKYQKVSHDRFIINDDKIKLEQNIENYILASDKDLNQLFEKLSCIYSGKYPVWEQEANDPGPFNVIYVKNPEPITKDEVRQSKEVCYKIIDQLKNILATKIKLRSVFLEYEDSEKSEIKNKP